MTFAPIFETLKSDAGVTSYLGDSPCRVYSHGEVPAHGSLDYAEPYVIYQQVGGNPENYIGQLPDSDDSSTQIDVYARTVSESRRVAIAVRDALEPHAHVNSINDMGKDPDTGLCRTSIGADWITYRFKFIRTPPAPRPPARVTAMTYAKSAILNSGRPQVNLLFCGDSTGDAHNEWIHMVAEQMAVMYPNHGVRYIGWDNARGAYADAEELAIGPRWINIYNASFAGSTMEHFMGARYPAAIDAVPADLVVWNHGKNLSDMGWLDESIRGMYMSAIEKIKKDKPGVGHVMQIQAPNRDSAYMENARRVQEAIKADHPYIDIVDTYKRYIDRNRPREWYIDDLHPSEAGSKIYLESFLDSFLESSAQGRASVPGSWIDASHDNLIENGDFSNWDDTLPAGWQSFNGGAAQKDTSNAFGGRGYSAIVTGIRAAASIRQILDSRASEFAGGTFSLAARVYVPENTSSRTVGGIVFQYGVSGGGSFNIRSVTEGSSKGGWRWIMISGHQFPAGMNALRVGCVSDIRDNEDSAINFDRIIMISGKI